MIKPFVCDNRLGVRQWIDSVVKSKRTASGQEKMCIFTDIIHLANETAPKCCSSPNSMPAGRCWDSPAKLPREQKQGFRKAPADIRQSTRKHPQPFSNATENHMFFILQMFLFFVNSLHMAERFFGQPWRNEHEMHPTRRPTQRYHRTADPSDRQPTNAPTQTRPNITHHQRKNYPLWTTSRQPHQMGTANRLFLPVLNFAIVVALVVVGR